MLTVERLIKELQKFPAKANVYAYEGEICGLVITLKKKELGYILAYESSSCAPISDPTKFSGNYKGENAKQD